MRVTNEQAECLVICKNYDWCEGCPKYDDGCPLRGTGIIFEKELATDLLEVRKLLKKAIDFLEYCNMDGLSDFLEHTREYR